jgi:hypothetical protein
MRLLIHAGVRFDAAGFSIWRVDFKYNEELTQVFMSSNQIGDFFSNSFISGLGSSSYFVP